VVSEPFEQIISEARTGVDWAGHALYRKFNPTLVQYLRAQDPEGADQLASQVWLNVATGLSRFQGTEAEFRKWILDIARRRLLEVRHEAEGPAGSDETPAPSVAS